MAAASSLLRVAARRGISSSFFYASPIVRSAPLARASVVPTFTSNFSTAPVLRSGEHAEETFEEFSARYERFNNPMGREESLSSSLSARLRRAGICGEGFFPSL
jgi:hypothetical protein